MDLGGLALSEAGTGLPHRRKRALILTLFAGVLLCGIAIGMVLSGGVSAGQESHLIQVNHAEPSPTPALSAAAALSEAFAEVARKVEPAVVHIETESSSDLKNSGPSDSLRRWNRPRRGTGSGVIVDASGFILTNQHVIDGASHIRVKLRDGRSYLPAVVGIDSETDLVVLRIKRDEAFPYAKMGDSSRLRVGDWVVAIGSPFGLEQTVTAGIISAKDRVTEGQSTNFQQFLQTDAAINPGNSGGPLINLWGEVVGINTQIPTNNGVFNGIGFALPSSIVVDVYNQLVRNGQVQRGFLGISMRPVEPEVAQVFEVPEGKGVLVENLAGEDSPAAQAGLRAGDVILEFDGARVSDPRVLSQRVAAIERGRLIPLKYLRDGETRLANVKVGLRPAIRPLDPPADHPDWDGAKDRAAGGGFPLRKQDFGAKLELVTSHAASALKLGSARGALVTETDDGGIAETLGLMTNDVIVKLNRTEIQNPDHLRSLLGDLRTKQPMVLEILRPRGLGSAPGHTFISGTVP